MTPDYETNAINRILVLVVMILAIILILPQAALGSCGGYLTDYLACIQTHDLNECACCVVTQSGTRSLSDLCPSLMQTGYCTKPIGVAITAPNVEIIGDINKPIYSTNPCPCCSVGILVAKINSNGIDGLNGVVIRNVNVKGWSNGIFFWKATGSTIKDSSMSENGHGIFLFNAQMNYIYSNHIFDNTKQVIMNPAGIGLESFSHTTGTTNNQIYDNIFDNPDNVAFYGPQKPNTWNIYSLGAGNIIGGTNKGGNYWADNGGGYSENCACGPDGFCTRGYDVKHDTGIGSPTDNTDTRPLCPYLSIEVNPQTLFWSLDPRENNGINLYPAVFTDPPIEIHLQSGSNWQVVLTPTQGGHLYSSALGKSLTHELEIGEDNGMPIQWRSVNSFSTQNSGGIYDFTYDLRQKVEWIDPPSQYSIRLEFIATPVI
jgi:parallel beta-helix repeat protein